MSFAGLSTALSALYAQRRGLDGTGQNIANANTEGYSRQRVDMQAVGGTVVPAMYATWSGAGAGVTVTDVTRLRDAFLDERGRIEHSSLSNLSAKQQILGRVEQIFNEPSDTGLQSQLADMWSAWDNVANRPGDLAARTQLLQTAEGVAGTLRNAHTTLASLWSTTRSQLDAQADEINGLAGTVADLNDAVVRANLAGLPANEFADQRDQLVLKLAQLTGARAHPRDNGAVDVLLGGSALVSGSTARGVAVTGPRLMNESGTVALEWVGNGAPVAVSAGAVAAGLEIVNPAPAGDTQSISLRGYAGKLDAVAGQLATVVNGQHAAGYDLDGAAGQPVFSFTDATQRAATIQLAITDPRTVAAATTFVPADPVAGEPVKGTLDGGNASAMAALATAVAGPDTDYRKLVVDLGVVAQSVNRQTGIQRVIVQGVDGSREAAAGVSLDEEMTNMISYQRAYEAATRVIATIDSTFDDLLNMIGR
jgi:flagellar hook-associated protein 1